METKKRFRYNQRMVSKRDAEALALSYLDWRRKFQAETRLRQNEAAGMVASYTAERRKMPLYERIESGQQGLPSRVIHNLKKWRVEF